MSQNSLTKEQIYKALKGQFPDKQEKHLREVSYNLCMANVSESSLFDMASRSFEKLMRFAPQSALAHQAANNQSNSIDAKPCPVCKVPMKLVNLLEGKTAHYCQNHKIAEPLPVL